MRRASQPAMPPFSLRALRPGMRLGLAVSGGADSVAMARLAHSLAARHGWVLKILHVQHGLRGEDSVHDAGFVDELATALHLPCDFHHADVAAWARQQGGGLEEAGRRLRYSWFRHLLSGELDAIATGHTLDDQAETVLAKLLRGAWTAGLAGIYPVVSSEDLPGDNKVLKNSNGLLVRPLLVARRDELRSWLTSLGQPWREDATNADVQFTRNRIRHELLPVLAGFNPRIAEKLTEVSTLAREDEDYWQTEVQRLLPGLLLPGRPVRGGGRASSTLPGERSLAMEVERLRALPPALIRRLLRATAMQLGSALGFEETERAIQLLEGPVGSVARREQLTAELRVERTPRELRLLFSQVGVPAAPVRIPVPGQGEGFGVHLRIACSGEGTHPSALLRVAIGQDRVRLRYSAGAPKRIKEVLERLGVPATYHQGWPLLEWQGEIVWLRGAVIEPTPLSSQLFIAEVDAPTGVPPQAKL